MIGKIVQHLKDRAAGKIPAGSKRSGEWPRVRAEHLVKNPNCAVCNGKEKVEVHHKKPFHLHPELELNPANLISLCEAKTNGINCHLLVGHLGNFHSLNDSVVSDAAAWNQKISTRPSGDKGTA